MNIDPSLLKCFYTWGLSIYPCILSQVMLETALDLPLPTEAPCPGWEEVGIDGSLSPGCHWKLWGLLVAGGGGPSGG